MQRPAAFVVGCGNVFNGAAHSGNRIVDALPVASRRRLLVALSRAYVPYGEVLYDVGAQLEHLYFIESGLISLTRPMRDGRWLEILSVGREGLVTPFSILGMDTAITQSIVRVPAVVLRIGREAFADRLRDDRELAKAVRAYGAAALHQLIQTTTCNASHSILERCCRWILTAHDSGASDTLALTHETIALALSVRRESVSTAAAELQRAGLIAYRHGSLTVTNRNGLCDRACECYATIRGGFDAIC